MADDDVSLIPDSMPLIPDSTGLQSGQREAPKDQASMLGLLKDYLEDFEAADQAVEIDMLQRFLSEWRRQRFGLGPDLSIFRSPPPASSGLPDTQNKNSTSQPLSSEPIQTTGPAASKTSTTRQQTERLTRSQAKLLPKALTTDNRDDGSSPSNSDNHEDRQDEGLQDRATGMPSKKKKEPMTKEDTWARLLNKAQGKQATPLLVHPEVFFQIRDLAMAKLGEKTTVKQREVAMLDRCILFWARVFGEEGKKQLRQFLSTIRHIHLAADEDIGASSERQATVETGAPQTIRLTLEAYQRQATTRTSAVVNRCMRYVHLSEFYHQYSLMVQDACDSKTETRQLFEKMGLKTSHGRNWRSVVNDYLVHKLDGVDFETVSQGGCKKSRIRLKNEIALSQPYQAMEARLGRGVFVLLPEQDITSFRAWSVNVLEVTLDCIVKLVPRCKQITRAIDINVIIPLEARRRPSILRVEDKAQDGNASLLDLVTMDGRKEVEGKRFSEVDSDIESEDESTEGKEQEHEDMDIDGKGNKGGAVDSNVIDLEGEVGEGEPSSYRSLVL